MLFIDLPPDAAQCAKTERVCVQPCPVQGVRVLAADALGAREELPADSVAALKRASVPTELYKLADSGLPERRLTLNDLLDGALASASQARVFKRVSAPVDRFPEYPNMRVFVSCDGLIMLICNEEEWHEVVLEPRRPSSEPVPRSDLFGPAEQHRHVCIAWNFKFLRGAPAQGGAIEALRDGARVAALLEEVGQPVDYSPPIVSAMAAYINSLAQVVMSSGHGPAFGVWLDLDEVVALKSAACDAALAAHMHQGVLLADQLEGRGLVPFFKQLLHLLSQRKLTEPPEDSAEPVDSVDSADLADSDSADVADSAESKVRRPL